MYINAHYDAHPDITITHGKYFQINFEMLNDFTLDESVLYPILSKYEIRISYAYNKIYPVKNANLILKCTIIMTIILL